MNSNNDRINEWNNLVDMIGLRQSESFPKDEYDEKDSFIHQLSRLYDDSDVSIESKLLYEPYFDEHYTVLNFKNQNNLVDPDTQLWSQDRNVLREARLYLDKEILRHKQTIDELQSKLNLKNQNNLVDTDALLSSQDHHNCNVLREAKLHLVTELLKQKQTIDELQSKLNLKTEEAKALTLKNSELEKKCEQLQVEKNEFVNKICEEFAAQRKCQQFLESGAYEKSELLKLRIQQLEQENTILKKSFLHQFGLPGSPSSKTQ